ncbi:SGNH hydrolase [Pluteus cervinus]|uniref:SGNH hydrolase n=1 Tax=Pluteus cervinus TaxID=181527 RepID=A0ACD3A6X3_9AGAR|nr:SGNH hydrolase [Pluteus cervinus]
MGQFLKGLRIQIRICWGLGEISPVLVLIWHEDAVLRLLAHMFQLLLALTALATGVWGQVIRIMPLGDSITGSPGCWRAILYNSIHIATIDMVGTLPPQGCGLEYDGDNEGHGGILATNIADQDLLPLWLNATRPDIVMMHLGTNDIWSNKATDVILTAFSKMVDQMRTSNPKMRILVAQILPMNPSNCGECDLRVQALNAALPAWAISKYTTESPIRVVDQYTGFDTTTDTDDGVHPNGNGTPKLAAKWLGPLEGAIINIIGPPPLPPHSTITPSTVGPTNTPTPTGGPPAPSWGQCGGRGWPGATTCTDGYVCKVSNEWFSQCVPA